MSDKDDRVIENLIKDLLITCAAPRELYPDCTPSELFEMIGQGKQVFGELEFHCEGLPDLLRDAELDSIAFEALQRLAASMMRAGAPLPQTLSTWVADVLDGRAIAPRQRGKHPQANLHRNLMIFCAISTLIEDGAMSATRNVASAHSNSACDVVAERLGMSYAAVAKVWRRQK